MVNVPPPSSYMQVALDLAYEASGTTWPRPAVGCVLMRDNQIIARAATQPGGLPHAEMAALSLAGKNANGATAYVTLEPCNHTSPNKPVPCTQGLINAGVAAVRIALLDPDPRVAGSGLAALRAAGIDAQIGGGGDIAYDIMRGHMMRVLKKRPFVTLKLAHSTDGFIARLGQRTPITGRETQTRVHALRGHVDAVVVGAETARIDQPQLTDRRVAAAHQPLRFVVDRSGDVETDLDRLTGATPHDNLQTLFDRGITHVLLEGGAKLAQGFLDAGLVDEFIAIEGDCTLGDGVAMPSHTLTPRSEETIGADIWRFYDSDSALALKRSVLESLPG